MPIISSSAVLEAPEPDTMLIEDVALPRGFVQLPKAVLYARHLSRDAKLLYAVLLGYAWQEQRCFPGYQRLCADLAARRECCADMDAGTGKRPSRLAAQARPGQNQHLHLA
jgi:hypothetical protein